MDLPPLELEKAAWLEYPSPQVLYLLACLSEFLVVVIIIRTQWLSGIQKKRSETLLRSING